VRRIVECNQPDPARVEPQQRLKAVRARIIAKEVCAAEAVERPHKDCLLSLRVKCTPHLSEIDASEYSHKRA